MCAVIKVIKIIIKIIFKILKCWTPKVEWSHPFCSKPYCWEIKETETYGSAMTGLWSSSDDWLKYHVKTYNIIIYIATYMQHKHVCGKRRICPELQMYMYTVNYRIGRASQMMVLL